MGGQEITHRPFVGLPLPVQICGRPRFVEDNTTQWSYGAHGQVITETITVSSNPLSRTFEYDAAGQLSRRIDRNGRVIDTSRDDLLRQTGETWYNNLTDADAQQNAAATITTK